MNTARGGAPRTWRLLPRGAGWVAYIWLVYLLNIPLVLFLMEGATASHWLWATAATALFLPLYFLGFWARGGRLLAVVVVMTVLAALATPLSPGANVFFIYAAGAAGSFKRARHGVSAVAGVFAAALLHMLFAFWVLDWPLAALLYGYLPPLVFVPVIGAVNIFYAAQRRQYARLRLAQEEVARLAEVAERERIARDLHDLLGHTLSVITLKSELATKLITRDAEKAAAEMRDVERISREALTEVRSAVRGYRAQGVQEELLSAATMLEAADISLESDVAPLALDPVQERALAFALREAVTNVVRHSGASRCTVRVSEARGEICLEVEDDGVSGCAAEGSGLRGMRERLAPLGGRLERTTDSGTRLRIYLPAAPESTPSIPETALPYADARLEPL